MEVGSPRSQLPPRHEFNAGVEAFLVARGTHCRTSEEFLDQFADWVDHDGHHGAPCLSVALRRLSVAERLELGSLLGMSDCSSASALSSVLRNQHLRTEFCSLAQLVSEKLLMAIDRGGKATCDEMLYALLCQLRLEAAAGEFATGGITLAGLFEQRDEGQAYTNLVEFLESKGVTMETLVQKRLGGQKELKQWLKKNKIIKHVRDEPTELQARLEAAVLELQDWLRTHVSLEAEPAHVLATAVVHETWIDPTNMHEVLRSRLMRICDSVWEATKPGGTPSLALPLTAASSTTREKIMEQTETLLACKQRVLNQAVVQYKVAVIGPMKAGKSTTVNTMVGISLAPKRVEAMTQIATSIEHKRGQHIPELHFKPAPFKAAIGCIRAIGLNYYGDGTDPAVLNTVRQVILDRMSSAVKEVYHTIVQAPLDRGAQKEQLHGALRKLEVIPVEAQPGNETELDQIWNTVAVLTLMQWGESEPEEEPNHRSDVSEGAPPGTDESVKVITYRNSLRRSEEAIRQWLTRLNDVARIACFFAANQAFEAFELDLHVKAMFDNLPEVKVRYMHLFEPCWPGTNSVIGAGGNGTVQTIPGRAWFVQAD